jgi:hypothetical protein
MVSHLSVGSPTLELIVMARGFLPRNMVSKMPLTSEAVEKGQGLDSPYRQRLLHGQKLEVYGNGWERHSR